MPTAAKLAAAVLFAALAWSVSRMVVPYFPEDTDLGRFAEVNAAIGAVLGWRIAGPRAGTSWTGAIGYGITCMVATVVVTLFVHALVIMIRQSLRKLYDGPVAAIADVFEMMVINGGYLLHQEVLLTLLAGAMLAGLTIEWFGRNFR